MKRDLFTKSEQLNKIVKNIREILYRWGYKEVFLPSVTKWKHGIRRGLKFIYCNELYLIKPDPTSQIFQNINGMKNTQRLFYVSEVLNGDIKGNFQLGIEIIGGKNSEIEIMFVIISILESLAIKNFYIDIGSLKVWRDNVKTESQWKTVIKALKNRDFELIETAAFEQKTKEKLWFLFNYRDKTSSYEKLNTIVKILHDPRIYIDFGTMRPLTYYEDIVFEIYSEKSGKPIGGGGDYTLHNGLKGVGIGFDLSVLASLAETLQKRNVVKIHTGELKKAYEFVRKGESISIEE